MKLDSQVEYRIDAKFVSQLELAITLSGMFCALFGVLFFMPQEGPLAKPAHRIVTGIVGLGFLMLLIYLRKTVRSMPGFALTTDKDGIWHSERGKDEGTNPLGGDKPASPQRRQAKIGTLGRE